VGSQRAETYLRLLAEAELRHAASAVPVSARRRSAGRTGATLDRMRWVPLALTTVRVLEVETAEAVLADYAAALGARPRFGRGRPMLVHAPSLPHGPWRAPWLTWLALGSSCWPPGGRPRSAPGCRSAGS